MFKYKINTTDGKSFIVLDNEVNVGKFLSKLMPNDNTVTTLPLQTKLKVDSFESNYIAIKSSHICSVEYLGE